MSNVINFCKQLISCRSISPTDAGCQILIKEHLSHLGFDCESMRFADVDNLWAKKGKRAPLVVFVGHTDVVPPGPENDWASPPFQADIREGYLYGRGATDMKGALAAMVIATEEFIQEKKDFHGSLGFLITSDEESKGVHGTCKVIEVLQQRHEIMDYCIIGEPSSDTLLGDQIRIGRRGSLHGKLTIHGKQGHVAHPHLAQNPIHLPLKALTELIETEWDQGNESFPATTLQITNIHAGTGATNVIPGHLETHFNLRFSTAMTVPELQQKIETIFHRHHLNFDLQWEIGGKPFLTEKSKLITATQLAIKEITGLDPKLSAGGGTSDGRFIAPTGAKIVELGVSHITAHQVNECVKIEDLEQLVKIYKKLLEILLLAC